MSKASPPKRPRVEQPQDENTRWSSSDEGDVEAADLFNLKGLLCAPVSLFATEELPADDDEDSSSTNDACSFIYSAAPPPPPETLHSDDEKVAAASPTFLYDPWELLRALPSSAHFAPQVARIIAEHGTLPALPAGATVRPTLVLDLDETLVHSSVVPLATPADFSFPVALDGNDFVVHCKKRPFCDEFLRACKDMGWELCIFTASKSVYADRVLDLLDPSGELLGGRTHRLFREHCIGYRGNFFKNLSVLQRDLARTVIVDNSPSAFALNVENGIPIESWFDDQTDAELSKLIGLLELLVRACDVRPLLARQFDLVARMRE